MDVALLVLVFAAVKEELKLIIKDKIDDDDDIPHDTTLTPNKQHTSTQRGIFPWERSPAR